MSITQTHLPYPAIEDHGIIGDRRTAALVAADGTIDWLCLPDYDRDIVFGSLIDDDRGGFWKLGPKEVWRGTQSYVEDAMSLVTTWDVGGARLELLDFMPWPANQRPAEEEDLRVVVRRLRCAGGQAECEIDLRPHYSFAPAETPVRLPSGAYFRAGPHSLWLWTSRPLDAVFTGVRETFRLQAGEEVWAVLVHGNAAGEWSVERAGQLLDDSERYWRQWAGRVSYRGPRDKGVRRSAMLVHLLSYAPTGAIVAAPTTSLPERIGGEWNADYRFSWIRDSSLSLDVLNELGCTEDTGRYLEFLCGLVKSRGQALQIVYGIRGETDLKQEERKDLYGYRGSKPVRLGNHAYQQHQHDATGYLVDCALSYLEHGGQWRPEFWDLIQQVTDYMARVWQKPGKSIWELSQKQHYVSDRVMSWVAFDRALKIADRLGKKEGLEHWHKAREECFAEVMEKGWSDKIRAFKQSYEDDTVDSAILLLPLMKFLPADHPRIRATVERIAETLVLDGFVYRFAPRPGAGVPPNPPPMGEYEGAFLPSTFWLAVIYGQLGLRERAEAILERAEAIAGPAGLFAEGVDTRQQSYLGNSPLLFSHVTYIRAVKELARWQDRS